MQRRSKPQKTFCLETDKVIINFIWKCKKSKIGKTILKKKNDVGGATLPVSRFTLRQH